MYIHVCMYIHVHTYRHTYIHTQLICMLSLIFVFYKACLALRSIQVLPDPLPSSLASIFLTPPSNDQWDRNGIDFESFCICYSELRYRCVQQNKDGWLSSLGSLVWAPVQWLKGIGICLDNVT